MQTDASFIPERPVPDRSGQVVAKPQATSHHVPSLDPQPGQSFQPDQLAPLPKQAPYLHNSGAGLFFDARSEYNQAIEPYPTLTRQELQWAYEQARAQNNGYRLFQVAQTENQQSLLPLKAGDILREAYESALAPKNPHLMYHTARYENQHQLIPELKAGDMLEQAVYAAVRRQDSQGLFAMADYEKNHQLMPKINAGDVLIEAYRAALKEKNIPLLRQIADYEEVNDLMTDISARDIRQEIQGLLYHQGF